MWYSGDCRKVAEKGVESDVRRRDTYLVLLALDRDKNIHAQPESIDI